MKVSTLLASVLFTAASAVEEFSEATVLSEFREVLAGTPAPPEVCAKIAKSDCVECVKQHCASCRDTKTKGSIGCYSLRDKTDIFELCKEKDGYQVYVDQCETPSKPGDCSLSDGDCEKCRQTAGCFYCGDPAFGAEFCREVSGTNSALCALKLGHTNKCKTVESTPAPTEVCSAIGTADCHMCIGAGCVFCESATTKNGTGCYSLRADRDIFDLCSAEDNEQLYVNQCDTPADPDKEQCSVFNSACDKCKDKKGCMYCDSPKFGNQFCGADSNSNIALCALKWGKRNDCSAAVPVSLGAAFLAAIHLCL